MSARPSRHLALLLASLVLSSIPVGYLQVVLPLYLNRAGLEPGLIGLLYSVSGVVTALLVAFSGLLADRFGRQRFLLWGTALPMVSYAIFAITTSPSWLLLASIVGGVGLANGAAGAMTAASFDALLAEHTPPRQRTSIFAWSQALWSLALAGGSLSAGLPELLRTAQPDLSTLESYRPPFLAIIVLAAMATVVLLPLREATPPLDAASTPASVGHAREKQPWWPRKSASVIARYSLALGLFGLGLGMAVQLLPLWLKLRFGVDEATMAPWYGTAQLLSLSSVVISPWLDRRLGSGLSVMIVHVLGAACLFAIALLAPTFQIAALAFLLRNVLANVAWPLQQALLMTRAAPEERASAAGVGFSVWGFTNAAGPAVGGSLMQAGSLTLPIVLGGIAYALGGLAFGLGFRRRRQDRESRDAPDDPLRWTSHGSGVVGEDGNRDGRQSRHRQSDRPRTGR